MATYEYKNYVIKFEYGGWGVPDFHMFDTKEAAEEYIDKLIELNTKVEPA